MHIRFQIDVHFIIKYIQYIFQCCFLMPLFDFILYKFNPILTSYINVYTKFYQKQIVEHDDYFPQVCKKSIFNHSVMINGIQLGSVSFHYICSFRNYKRHFENTPI